MSFVRLFHLFFPLYSLLSAFIVLLVIAFFGFCMCLILVLSLSLVSVGLFIHLCVILEVAEVGYKAL